MDLFQLFGVIAIKGADKANSDINKVSTNAQKSSSIIDKLGTTIQNTFKSKPIQEVDTSVEKLTNTMTSQQNKLDLLKRKYADLYLAQGKNSKEAKECAAEIKKLSSELEDNRKALAEATSAADKYDDSLENVSDEAGMSGLKIGGSTKSLGSIVKTVGSSIIGILGSIGGKVAAVAGVVVAAVAAVAAAAGIAAAAVGTVATGVGYLSKASIEVYASYEQLVGGVETLFGDSAKTVQKYADNAYKTAGLSANAYMETVTSFSASLLQSLEGDTEKAAAYADRAITDMSDNANKMGTDMASIQSAYQGFAKQNYTMLDNLKLGYGGTQEEMQRLIQDAAALKDIQKELGITVDEDSMSFANIVNAISVIQESMGISGTTAKEAATTIQGSLSSLEAAWTNLLNGLADSNQNMDTLIDNFVSSFITAADNIVPRLAQTFSGISSGLEKIIPLISAQLPGMIESLLPGVLSGLATLTSGILQGLPALIRPLLDAIPSIFTQFGSILLDAVPLLCASFADVFDQLIGFILAVMIGEYTADIKNMTGKISEALMLLYDCIVAILVPLWNALVPFLGELLAVLLPAVLDLLNSVLRVLSPVLGLLTPILNLLKPIFNFVVGFLKPLAQLVSLVSLLVTYLAPVVDFLAEIVDTVLFVLQSLLSAVLGVLTGILTALGSFIERGIGLFKERIAGAIKTLLNGVTDFITGIFSGDLEKALGGISKIFDMWAENFGDMFNIVHNSIIDGINSMIRSLNTIKLPDWIPGIGGTGIDIPEIPQMEQGGVLEKGQIGLLTGILTALGSFIERGIGLFKERIAGAIKTLLNGVTDFITGIFSGDLEKALGGISKIFDMWAENFGDMFNIVHNSIIDGINSMIRSLNTIKLPDWIPGIGGTGIDIPEIPQMEQGGVLEKGQIGLLEGNGAEAVVPLHQNKKWISAVAQDMDSTMGGDNTAVVTVLQEILVQLKIIANSGNDQLASLLAQILDSMGDDLKDQISNTTIQIDKRVAGRVVRGLV